MNACRDELMGGKICRNVSRYSATFNVSKMFIVIEMLDVSVQFISLAANCNCFILNDCKCKGDSVHVTMPSLLYDTICRFYIIGSKVSQRLLPS